MLNALRQSLTALGIPVGFGTVYAYEAQKANASILLTQPPVQKDPFYRSATINRWYESNSARIRELFPELASQGHFIVTIVYHTSRESTNVMRSSGNLVRVGFKASAVGIGEIAPSTEWAKSSHDAGWVDATAADKDCKVVFFGGLHYKWRFRPWVCSGLETIALC